MKTLSLISVLVVTTTALSALVFSSFSSAAAESPSLDTKAADASPLIVAELFTSQSCSSCPPAEALFSDLAERDDLLTMEWHVDYWDQLVHGGSKWKDLYSSKAFTQRQRSYNRSLRGKSAVYTPQAIVNGKTEGVGNRRGKVTDLLEAAKMLSVPVTINNNVAEIGGSASATDILFVRLLKQHETDVKGGENKGRKLAGKNIVLEANVIGQTGTGATSYKLPSIGENESCAVLVQSQKKNVGPIIGAAKC